MNWRLHSEVIRVISRLLVFLLAWVFGAASNAAIFGQHDFTSKDAILVIDDTNQVVFEWNADKALIPASLTKLATAHLAIEKWGLEHRFTTDFFVDGSTLWIKGYGDPFIVSEELDLIAQALTARGINQPSEIRIDNSYFAEEPMPGRSAVSDPYNAPLSAVSANFNTAMLQTRDGRIVSAEPQTPLTDTARRVGHSVSGGVERINLINRDNAQRNFAELLQSKAGWESVSIQIDQSMPSDLTLVYRHKNSRTLSDVIRGMLEFSNNFMANHVFLKLGDNDVGFSRAAEIMNFERAREYAVKHLQDEFDWQGLAIVEGSGLSRKNRLSARQLSDLLQKLRPHRTLFKQYESGKGSAMAYAKTGSLTDVHSFAGFIDFADRHYRFVFNFNRSMPYKYRERLLQELVSQLAETETGS